MLQISNVEYYLKQPWTLKRMKNQIVVESQTEIEPTELEVQ